MTVRSIILRVHRWLGVVATVPLVLLGLSGAVLTFETELDRTLNPQLWKVTADGPRRAWQEVVDRVAAEFPKDKAMALRLPQADDVAAEIALKSGLLVYSDPYTGEVRGSRRRQEILTTSIHQFHTNLLLGPPGSWVQGTTALALIALSGSGLFLWIRTRISTLRWRGSFRRFVFDTHSALGLYASLLWLIVGGTGAIMTFEEVGQPALYWMTRATPPEPPPLTSTPREEASWLTVDAVVQLAAETLPGAVVTLIALPTKRDGVFAAYMKFPEDRTPAGRSRVYVDSYDGRVLGMTNTRTVPVGVWLWNHHRSLHTGDVFGWPTRLLVCAASLLVVVQAVSGLVMWWQARRRFV